MSCKVTVNNGPISEAEQQAYIDRAVEKYGREPLRLDITVDGDEVELRYDFGSVPFHRIRRITGYLSVRSTASITPSALRSATWKHGLGNAP
jgi:hypothetical protein